VSLHRVLLCFLSAVIQFSVLPSSVSVLSVTPFVFASIKELRESTYGKIIITLVLNLTIVYISMPCAVFEWFHGLSGIAQIAQLTVFLFVLWSLFLALSMMWTIR
jgi:hypothetical protein